MSDYWTKQSVDKPLFTDVVWSKPERRDQAGRLAVVGGNAGGFVAVASAYAVASRQGVGQVRAIVPDVLEKKIPLPIRSQIDDLIFAPSNPSGGFSLAAINEIAVASQWSGNVLLIGDSGANSETAQLVERFLSDQQFYDTKVVVARDAIDLIMYSAETVLNRPNIHLVMSLAQFQKLARLVYYPRMITFNQGIKQMAETLHKFSITYPATITIYHDGNLFVAHDGRVVSMEFDNPMRIWNGEIPAKIAAWGVWSSDTIKSTATAWIE